MFWWKPGLAWLAVSFPHFPNKLYFTLVYTQWLLCLEPTTTWGLPSPHSIPRLWHSCGEWPSWKWLRVGFSLSLFHLRGLCNWMGAKIEEGRGRNRDYRGRCWAAWSSVLCVCRGLALQRSSYLWASFKVCLQVFIIILGWDDVGAWLPRFTIGKLMPTNLNSRPPWRS